MVRKLNEHLVLLDKKGFAVWKEVLKKWFEAGKEVFEAHNSRR
jgi:hypothetical protein